MLKFIIKQTKLIRRPTEALDEGGAEVVGASAEDVHGEEQSQGQVGEDCRCHQGKKQEGLCHQIQGEILLYNLLIFVNVLYLNDIKYFTISFLTMFIRIDNFLN